MCTRHFGSTAANTVRTFRADELPLLLIISRNRGTNEVISVIRGEGFYSQGYMYQTFLPISPHKMNSCMNSLNWS